MRLYDGILVRVRGREYYPGQNIARNALVVIHKCSRAASTVIVIRMAAG